MSPKSGKAGTPVAPKAPKSPTAPVNVTGGNLSDFAASKAKAKKAEMGKINYKPHQPPPPPPPPSAQAADNPPAEEEKLEWFEFQLKDESGNPIPGEYFEVVLPDGETMASGTTDEEGKARIEGVKPGDCDVHFPELEDDQWSKQ